VIFITLKKPAGKKKYNAPGNDAANQEAQPKFGADVTLCHPDYGG